ncbi:hypothetical protein D3C72_1938880 [compost metagenome]
MAVAPLHQADQHRQQLDGRAGGAVFEAFALAGLAVADLAQQAGVGQRLEARGQHRGRAFQPAQEVVEARHAMEDIAQDQDRPLFADQRQRRGNRAVAEVGRIEGHDAGKHSMLTSFAKVRLSPIL